MNVKQILWMGCMLLAVCGVQAQNAADTYHEPYRPQVHFSPKAHWMNDPNGMVYENGTYHLFFQYYPGATVWGPMHWGHAESKDLIYWHEQPVALYPDSLGYIFSGSAVADVHNTSGFGSNGTTPLVAIFTHHDPKGEKAGTDNFQNQSLAYSLNHGRTWTKYAGNPVLKNPGIHDFRDPKVMWYEAGKKWVMTLATKDRVTFYSSPNLKSWTKESEFGLTRGAHGGVWECPDLFPLQLNGKTYWVLLVSINPGGPNGGSLTQYFTGQFDGHTFTESGSRQLTKWIDYGPDDYAGVTWFNTGNRKIFLGWMSNWLYAAQVPTVKWRNAMTIPRELALKQINHELYLTSVPVKEVDAISSPAVNLSAAALSKQQLPAQYELLFSMAGLQTYKIILSNHNGEKLIIGYDKSHQQYFIDRSQSGIINFNPEFKKMAYAPRITTQTTSDLKLLVDASSIEVFADNGLTVMTSVCFPKTPYSAAQLVNEQGMVVKSIKLMPLKSIW